MLLWKEWRENWVLLIAGMVAVVILAMAHRIPPDGMLISESGDLLLIIYCIVVCYACVVGATMVAPEVGNGTINELFARPISPLKIWLSKVVYGLLTICVMYFFAELVGSIAAREALPLSGFQLLLHDGEGFVAVTHSVLLLLPVALFAIALFSSTLATQTVLAFLGATVIAAIFVFPGTILATWPEVIFQVYPFEFAPAYEGSLGYAFGDMCFLIVPLTVTVVLFLRLSARVFLEGDIHVESSERKLPVAFRCLGMIALWELILLYLSGQAALVIY